MARYECPSCGGGFPAPEPGGECPWCSTELDGDYGGPLTLPDGPTNGTVPTHGETSLDIPDDGATAPRYDPGCIECGADLDDDQFRRCEDCAGGFEPQRTRPFSEKL